MVSYQRDQVSITLMYLKVSLKVEDTYRLVVQAQVGHCLRASDSAERNKEESNGEERIPRWLVPTSRVPHGYWQPRILCRRAPKLRASYARTTCGNSPFSPPMAHHATNLTGVVRSRMGSGWGSGRPLTGDFIGSKPLPYLSLTCPYLYSVHRLPDGSTPILREGCPNGRASRHDRMSLFARRPQCVTKDWNLALVFLGTCSLAPVLQRCSPSKLSPILNILSFRGGIRSTYRHHEQTRLPSLRKLLDNSKARG